MVAGGGGVAVDEVVGHEVDIVNQRGYILPVDGGLQIVGITAGGETDLFFFPQFLPKQADEGGEMVFVFGVEGIAGDVDEGGVFPVEVDAVGVEVVGQFFNRLDEFGAAVFGGEDVGTGFAAAPAAEGEDDFEARVRLLEGDQFFNGGGIPRIIHVKLIAVEVAEAENDMGEFAGGEAVDGRASTGV